MVDNSMATKDLILSIATEMNKTPEQMQKFISALEENMVDTVQDLRDLTDDDFKQMSFPIALVNRIKKRL